MIRVLLAALLLVPDLSFAAQRLVAPAPNVGGSRVGVALPALPPVAIANVGASNALPGIAVPQAPQVTAIGAVHAIAADQGVVPGQAQRAQDPQQAAQDLSRRYDASAASPEGPAPVGPGGEGSGAAPLAPSSEGSSAGAPKIPALPVTPAGKRPFFIRHYKLARAIMWPVLKLVYRVQPSGVENLPAGPALIVPNHVSYVDALMVSFAANRPMRFMLQRRIYARAPRFFDALGAIPVSGKDSREKIDASLSAARGFLADGQTVVIFPEGQLTKNGNMVEFKRGFERIAEGLSVPVVPAHLDNLWGSFFSLKGVSALRALREVPRPIGVRFGAPLAEAAAQPARDAVQELSTDALAQRVRRDQTTLARAFLDSAKSAWKKRAMGDSTGQDLAYGRTLTGSILLSRELEKRLGQAKNVGVLIPPSVGGALANVALSIGGRVPINFNYSSSAEAVEHAAKTSGVAYVVTSKKAVEKLKEKGQPVPERPMIFLEDILPAVPQWKKSALYVALRLLPRRAIEALFFRKAARSLDDVATIVYTSGSTSLPKGVELTHLNLMANMQMVEDTFPFTSEETLLGTLPFFHSFGFTMTLWFPLTRGLAAAYHSHPLELGPIQKLAEKFQPTLALGTPTFLHKYAEKIKKEAFARLKYAIAGAEALYPETVALFEKAFGVRPLEGYGATELSPVAIVSVPDRDGQTGAKAGMLGQNLPGTAVRVVDPTTLKPLAYGEEGLLLVKGPHVMKGYIGQPDKTAEAVRDGWYFTGDLVSRDRGGFIKFLGRAGIKIAGEYVPAEAVAERLKQAAGAGAPQFVVTSVPDVARGERLVVLHTKWEGGDPQALVAALKKTSIPGIWVPSPASFYEVDPLPTINAGMKLDLKAIKKLAAELEAKRTNG